MLTGYCHFTGALVLVGATLRVTGPASFARQLGVEARREFGDLVEISSDTLVPPAVSDLIERFVASFRTGDEAALAELVKPWDVSFHDDPEGERLFRSVVKGEASSPLAFLRRASPVQQAYFYERLSRRDQEFGDVPTWHVCFCRTADCTGRWPIAAIDSQVHEQRPYACLRTTMGSGGLHHPPEGLAIIRGGGLAEPVAREQGH